MQIKSLAILVIFSTTFVLARRSGNERAIGNRIVGGYEVSIEKVPFQAAIFYEGWLLCGGSILSPRYILTAAHCTDKTSRVSDTTVRVGSSEYANGGTVHQVGRIDQHPNWDDFLYDYDASILTLRTKIVFDRFKQPVELPYMNEAIPAGTFVSATGWGLTQNDSQSNSILRQVELRVVYQFDCFKAYQSDGGVTTRMVCASGTGKDTCDGDSGGPLIDMRTKKQVGIVSFGPYGSCATDGIPGVYTRIPSIRQWIRQIIKF